MKVLAIDPGNIESGWCYYDTEAPHPVAGKVDNEVLLAKVASNIFDVDHLVIEQIKSYGMPAGDSIHNTNIWIGEFKHAWRRYGNITLIPRKTICTHICNSPRANDSNIRAALLDRYPPSGGGATPQVGTKAQPGPLYGFAKDMWSALAVAVTYVETFALEEVTDG